MGPTARRAYDFYSASVEYKDSGARLQIPAMPLTGCATLNKSLTLSGLQFSHL